MTSIDQKFKSIKKLGHGSFGDVILYERLSNKQLVAIKKIDLSRNPRSDINQVKEEIKLLQALSHPLIIQYHEYYEESNNEYSIIMEYADNGDLLQVKNEAKKKDEIIEEEKILSWFVQLLIATKYLHDLNIIHRDIKLQNIFYTQKGLVKIGDFGIAKRLDNSQDLANTSLGTPYYVSPEICKGIAYNHKSDVWMLGCALYELCAREKPFAGNSLLCVIKQIVEKSHKPLSDIYSKEIRELIDRMLSKTPEKRPSVNEILQQDFIIKQINILRKQYKELDELFDGNELKKAPKSFLKNYLQFSINLDEKKSVSSPKNSDGSRNHFKRSSSSDRLRNLSQLESHSSPLKEKTRNHSIDGSLNKAEFQLIKAPKMMKATSGVGQNLIKGEGAEKMDKKKILARLNKVISTNKDRMNNIKKESAANFSKIKSIMSEGDEQRTQAKLENCANSNGNSNSNINTKASLRDRSINCNSSTNSHSGFFNSNLGNV